MESGSGSAETGAPLSEEGVAELRAQLLAAVRRSCPPWLSGHAEDIAQAATLRVLAAMEKSGGRLEPNPSYLKKAAYSAAVDEMRRHFRRREQPVEERSDLEQVPARSVPPDRAIAALEIHGGLRDCLGSMLRARRAAVACHLQGYSVPETARFLGWTAKKTEHLVRRGLADLRTCLAAKGLTP